MNGLEAFGVGKAIKLSIALFRSSSAFALGTFSVFTQAIFAAFVASELKTPVSSSSSSES